MSPVHPWIYAHEPHRSIPKTRAKHSIIIISLYFGLSVTAGSVCSIVYSAVLRGSLFGSAWHSFHRTTIEIVGNPGTVKGIWYMDLYTPYRE